MKLWGDLYRGQRAARGLGSRSWSSELRKRLVALSREGYCDPSVEGRFTLKRAGDVIEWSIRDGGASAPLPLRQLVHLPTAKLSVMALADRNNHLHQFTVMVEGKRADCTTWSLAVHFEDDRVSERNPDGDRKGTGACGHAAVHCHVGPDLDTAPKVRVPLPALGPVEALDWVLSQIITTNDFEPAPWADVQAALKKAST